MILFFLIARVLAQFPEEDNVWVLDTDTFPNALDVQNKLLIEFYAP